MGGERRGCTLNVEGGREGATRCTILQIGCTNQLNSDCRMPHVADQPAGANKSRRDLEFIPVNG
jgi:hypothetical protein